MEKIKSCTNLEQSKKLAKILPKESADMFYAIETSTLIAEPPYDVEGCEPCVPFIPCWSLAALLDILAEQDFTIKAIENEFNIDIPIRHCKIWFPSLFDAAFEMVVWLKENKKL